MASGFKIAGGTDLDDIFGPYVSGTKPSNTGFKVAGVDIKDRYQPIATGTPVSATGFKISGGTDLNTVFGAAAPASLSVSVSPVSPLYNFNPILPGTAMVSTTATPSGGVGPYTILWARIAGSTSIVILSATSFTPSWSLTTASPIMPIMRSATWRGTITDSLGATAFVDVEMTMQVGGEPP